MRNEGWLLGLGIAAILATASGATEARSSIATCGHVEELAAAKRALAEGDKTRALLHLRNADALLSQCERESERAVQPGDTESIDATVVGGAEAPPTPAA